MARIGFRPPKAAGSASHRVAQLHEEAGAAPVQGPDGGRVRAEHGAHALQAVQDLQRCRGLPQVHVQLCERCRCLRMRLCPKRCLCTAGPVSPLPNGGTSMQYWDVSMLNIF